MFLVSMFVKFAFETHWDVLLYGALQQEFSEFVVVLKEITDHIQSSFILLDCHF